MSSFTQRMGLKDFSDLFYCINTCDFVLPFSLSAEVKTFLLCNRVKRLILEDCGKNLYCMFTESA